MTLFDSPDFADHEHVSFFSDPASGLRAIVAIHSTVPVGIAGGGCRMWPYASEDDALIDALRLSRAMTYKLALANLPAGGAKAVVIGDPATDKSEALLRALGRAVHRLGGRFMIAEDVGTTPEDMRVIAGETPYVVGQRNDPAPATAYGVLIGIQAAVARKLGRSSLDGLRVAIQGVGDVGAQLGRLLARLGARLVLSDIDSERALRVAQELAASVVTPEEIYALDVDVFAPCALGAVLDDETIAALRCSVVAGSANNPLADENRHAAELERRGILYAPDFVINAGGVIGAAHDVMEPGSDGAERLPFAEIGRIGDTLHAVFQLALREGISTHAAAVRMAKEAIAHHSIRPPSHKTSWK
jgi:leucine dehydrogenase